MTITLFAATESDGLGHTLIIGSTGRGKVTDEYWKAFALTEDEFMLVRRAGHPGGQ
ncbi:hypothetical protein MYA_6023 (plasmid) [Burkholderia sp. KJ006]|nr:hypothetical protein MYA_6023 [Burkholderia sp. KJ006]